MFYKTTFKKNPKQWHVLKKNMKPVLLLKNLLLKEVMKSFSLLESGKYAGKMGWKNNLTTASDGKTSVIVDLGKG